MWGIITIKKCSMANVNLKNARFRQNLRPEGQGKGKRQGKGRKERKIVQINLLQLKTKNIF